MEFECVLSSCSICFLSMRCRTLGCSNSNGTIRSFVEIEANHTRPVGETKLRKKLNSMEMPAYVDTLKKREWELLRAIRDMAPTPMEVQLFHIGDMLEKRYSTYVVL